MAASVRRALPNSRMFQVARLSVSSIFEDGIFAAAMRFLSATNPAAISLETFPWFMVLCGDVLTVATSAAGARIQVTARLGRPRLWPLWFELLPCHNTRTSNL